MQKIDRGNMNITLNSNHKHDKTISGLLEINENINQETFESKKNIAEVAEDTFNDRLSENSVDLQLESFYKN